MRFRDSRLLRTVLCALLLVSGNVLALDWTHINYHQVWVCPGGGPIPTFEEPTCKTQSFFNGDPQGQAIWLKASLHLPKHWQEGSGPYAFYLFAKASSEVYLNGRLLGTNGRVAQDGEQELAGRMDTRFYVPPDVIKEGENWVVMHLSSHQSLLRLSSPLHLAALGKYQSSTEYFGIEPHIQLSVLCVLVLGVLYLLGLRLSPLRAQIPTGLLWLFGIAAVQLALEQLRGWISYPYPMHDVRLILILLCALGFGCGLLAYLLRSCQVFIKTRLTILALSTSLTLLVVFFSPGFDQKTTLAVALPVLIGILVSGRYYYQARTSKALVLVAMLCAFLLAAILSVQSFHSLLFYIMVTALLGGFLGLHIRHLGELQTQSIIDQQAIAKLQVKLAQLNQADEKQYLNLTYGSSTERIDVRQLIWCRAAGDYVELNLEGGGERLYSGSLKSLLDKLPATFMQVHRSYLVDLDKVRKVTLNKDKAVAGYAFLYLCEGERVPVSRRLFAQVRESIE
ncbi:LytTR family DNA-binding domain-containing protein [Pseudoalteromonas sp. R3]|uniref:LytR/AlgR family response regulator transcription factor n=1 Tax=Pseudoalteromonas sp. R3 TaxID=1709477 RepID=UPI0006B46D09|nr:LytTR family DNA-binding domain-containing protein [Pseudoalteromonas sp. R3]AZZ97801.1 DNA-binding protein [Pseudoalteromonas sp. R3]